ncbi:MAG: HPr kinase/phosphatase C-terminal domain-containing protein [Alphaproteobacteria bacterium]|nr:HPr kinase/phosphatase C-terminal domain-containing protein [Alphaproteobacteria bacterium]
MTVSGTAVALHHVGVLFRGPAGSGKSDLALRLIDQGAKLIADDLVQISRQNQDLYVTYPEMGDPKLKGCIEIRGIGIVSMNFQEKISLNLILDLTERDLIVRLPQITYDVFFNISVPKIFFDPFASSAISKIHWAIKLFSKKL